MTHLLSGEAGLSSTSCYHPVIILLSPKELAGI